MKAILAQNFGGAASIQFAANSFGMSKTTETIKAKVHSSMRKKRPSAADIALEQFKANSIFAVRDVLHLFDRYVVEARQAVRSKEYLDQVHARGQSKLYAISERLNTLAGELPLKQYPQLRRELRSIADSVLELWRGR